MASRGYHVGRAVARVVRNQCVIELVLDRWRLRRDGGFVLAATHLGHVEPGLIASHTGRTIHWLARVEFFRHPLAAAALRFMGALPVKRGGVPARTIRRAIDLARAGEVVGIFPEGGVVPGRDAMFRGGPARLGACVIAWRARVPIVPCVILGTDHMRSVGPFLPAKRARAWIAYGHPIAPPPATMRAREARLDMGRRMRAEFERLYQELLARSGVREQDVP